MLLSQGMKLTDNSYLLLKLFLFLQEIPQDSIVIIFFQASGIMTALYLDTHASVWHFYVTLSMLKLFVILIILNFVFTCLALLYL